MKIVSYAISKRLEDCMRSKFGRDFSSRPEPLVPQTADPEAEIAIITVASSADASVLSRMGRLKALVTASTGTDNIDMYECRRRRLEVRNCPTYATNAVAELAIALALSALRDLQSMAELGRNPDYPLGFAMGSELSGKTCAVLGTGRIGSRIAKILLAFDCGVVAYSRSSKKELIDMGVRYVPLAKAMKADIIFITLPGSKETYHLLGDKELSMLQDNAAIVNVARGEIIDSEALLEHIDRLAFVTTDVLEGQSSPISKLPKAIHSLLKKRNLFHTPYIGVCTSEAFERLAD
ncbi:MAG: 2-hydroxyacid dehydrogenase, partial [Candidatus ainarchaeum sp.]|nr:2-hydroxyacid dehydrogenase [Candidatus ainarchaeum sp.]